MFGNFSISSTVNAVFHVYRDMIDLCMYRQRIGCYTPTSKQQYKRNKLNHRSFKREMSKFCSGNLDAIWVELTLGYLVL